jgi:hypothetical protein
LRLCGSPPHRAGAGSPALAATPQYSGADYWAFADRHMAALDVQWDPGRAAYMAHGNASTRENSMFLRTHAVAALAGHEGATRQDAIASGLGALRAADPPALYAYDYDTGRLAVSTPR